MADQFSIDPEALADAAQRMGDFVRHTESVVAEIDSLVTHGRIRRHGLGVVVVGGAADGLQQVQCVPHGRLAVRPAPVRLGVRCGRLA